MLHFWTTIGHGLSVIGGSCMSMGLCATLTIAGAPMGIPLLLLGAVMMGLAMVCWSQAEEIDPEEAQRLRQQLLKGWFNQAGRHMRD